MRCCLCEKTAFYRVGERGFCSNHRVEANAANVVFDQRVAAERTARSLMAGQHYGRHMNMAAGGSPVAKSDRRALSPTLGTTRKAPPVIPARDQYAERQARRMKVKYGQA